MTRALLLLAFPATLAACAGVSGTATPEAAAVKAAQPVGEEVPALGELSVANLPNGSCGMLLWTMQNQTPRLVFRSVVGGEAMTVLDGVQTPLKATQVGGERLHGVSADQSFIGAHGEAPVKVTVTGRFGQRFDSGVYVEKAIISVVDTSGWERVTPAAGIAGCRP